MHAQQKHNTNTLPITVICLTYSGRYALTFQDLGTLRDWRLIDFTCVSTLLLLTSGHYIFEQPIG